MTRRRAAAAVGVLLLTACSSTGAEAPAAPGTRSVAGGPPALRYVALGDSYTSAPFVPVTDLAGGCARSDGNYAHLLADALGATLTDVSCAGATTRDLTARQSVAGGRGTVPPQLHAVRRDTDLVTVGIGGNDGGLFLRLAGACIGPDQRPLARCRPLAPALSDAARVIGRTGRSVTAALRAVRRAAPRAEIVLVGYPRLALRTRSCAALPLSDRDRTAVARLEQRLDAALAAAARTAGALFAAVHTASQGHEVCSSDPWVNGARTDPQQALGFHPFAVEQRAVADAVAALVTDGTDGTGGADGADRADGTGGSGSRQR